MPQPKPPTPNGDPPPAEAPEYRLQVRTRVENDELICYLIDPVGGGSFRMPDLLALNVAGLIALNVMQAQAALRAEAAKRGPRLLLPQGAAPPKV